MIELPKEPRLIGPALANLRKMLGVTQDELVARGVGNQGVISALENGHTMPLMVTVMAYLSALGYKLGAFPDPKVEE
ncbi:MAG: helix-turn-helix domain-containing protein [Actinoplanes sp.]